MPRESETRPARAALVPAAIRAAPKATGSKPGSSGDLLPSRVACPATRLFFYDRGRAGVRPGGKRLDLDRGTLTHAWH